MFYDIDILHRRGKFGLIWLAAHDKLRVSGDKRGDLKAVLNLNLPRIIKDLRRYLAEKVPPSAPNQPKPKFSLYLAAMLAHGACVIHHLQVKHDVASFLLHMEKRSVVDTKKKKTPSLNVNCESRLRSAGVDRQLPKDFEPEDGVEAAIQAVLNTSQSFRHLPSQRSQVAEQGLLRDEGLCTPEMIARDFLSDYDEDLAKAFTNIANDPNGHYTTAGTITIREEEPIVRPVNQFEEDVVGQDLGDGFGNRLEEVDPCLLSVAVDGRMTDDDSDDGREGRRRSTLVRSNSKRVHDSDPASESTPSKLRRPQQLEDEPIASDLPPLEEPVIPVPIEVDPMHLLQNFSLSLQPLENDVRAPGRRRSRIPRLIVDRIIGIPNEDFRANMENYRDTQRVTSASHDAILPTRKRRIEAGVLLRRPGRIIRGDLLRELFNRNLTRRHDYEDRFDVEANADQPRIHLEQMDVDLPDEIAAAARRQDRENDTVRLPFNRASPLGVDVFRVLEDDQQSRPIDHAPSGVAVIANNALPAMPLFANAPMDETGTEPEQGRSASRNASLVGSLLGVSMSRAELSSTEHSFGSAGTGKERILPQRQQPMETVTEASIEVSTRQSCKGKQSGTSIASRRDTTAGASTALPPPTVMEEEEMELPDVPAELSDVNPNQLGNFSTIDPAQLANNLCRLSLSPPRRRRHHHPRSSPDGPEEDPVLDDELLEAVQAAYDDRADEVGKDGFQITFRELVPPTSNDRMQSAGMFEALLALKKKQLVGLRQKPTNGLVIFDISIHLA